MNIVLVGMPGSGKTTVSKILAKMLKMAVADTDCMITDSYGDISEIFKCHGECGFRDIETEIIKRACLLENTVISTGGGAVLREENVREFKKNGKIVYLKTDVETLFKRVDGDASRPLLSGDKMENLKRLYAERRHIYEGSADFSVDCAELSPQEIAKKITEFVK